MLADRRICVVLPAYNAGRTLETTFREIPLDVVDDVILVDDASTDDTLEVAKRLGIFSVTHNANRGYGGNQKTCYRMPWSGAPTSSSCCIRTISTARDCCCRWPPCCARGCSMWCWARAFSASAPSWWHAALQIRREPCLTLAQNILLGHKLSEYHTGYRGFTRSVIEALPLERNSDDFVFDNQMLSQAIYRGFRIGEISCPTKYFAEASSINFQRSVIYGMGVLKTSVGFRLARCGLDRGTIFEGLRK